MSRVKTEFENRFQEKRKISGTGFWLNQGRNKIFVTNRHNLDPDLAIGPYSGFALAAFSIELRAIDKNKPTAETKFFNVSNPEAYVPPSEAADCAVFIEPSFTSHEERFTTLSIGLHQLADHEWVLRNLRLMDSASFVGFPGSGNVGWWDEEWSLPIARLATIASLPQKPYINSGVSTSNVSLVSGLSFSGSSGSPLISHGKPNVPPKIIGIMSGHWQENEHLPDLIKHSGLSYFTRSTSIFDILNKAGIVTAS